LEIPSACAISFCPTMAEFMQAHLESQNDFTTINSQKIATKWIECLMPFSEK